jgi:Protein of unknown function (DUF1269)
MTGLFRMSDGKVRHCIASSHQEARCPSCHFAAGPARVVVETRKQIGKDDQMEKTDTIIAVFPDHNAAEGAVKRLAQVGFDMKSLSVVGKGYHTDEKVVGFYNAGDRVKFWGRQGAFWGALWGLFFGGLFITIPIVGSVAVVGYLASVMIASIESAIVVGGVSALGAALYSIGVPKDSVIQYETALKADSFLLMAHVPAAEIDRAKAFLAAMSPSQLDVHAAGKAVEVPGNPVHAAAG